MARTCLFLISVVWALAAAVTRCEELLGSPLSSAKQSNGKLSNVSDRIKSYQTNTVQSLEHVFSTLHLRNETNRKVPLSFTRIEPSNRFNAEALQALRDLLTPKIKIYSSPQAAAATGPAFTCQSLPQPYDPHYFCAGVVDYPFVVADGVTVLDMELQARGAVQYLTSFINAPCLSDMKRLICASLYQPCVGKGENCTLYIFHKFLHSFVYFSLVLFFFLCVLTELHCFVPLYCSSSGWGGHIHGDGGACCDDSIHPSLRVSNWCESLYTELLFCPFEMYEVSFELQSFSNYNSSAVRQWSLCVFVCYCTLHHVCIMRYWPLMK